jgi:hypothetical protein
VGDTKALHDSVISGHQPQRCEHSVPVTNQAKCRGGCGQTTMRQQTKPLCRCLNCVIECEQSPGTSSAPKKTPVYLIRTRCNCRVSAACADTCMLCDSRCSLRSRYPSIPYGYPGSPYAAVMRMSGGTWALCPDSVISGHQPQLLRAHCACDKPSPEVPQADPLQLCLLGV